MKGLLPLRPPTVNAVPERSASPRPMAWLCMVAALLLFGRLAMATPNVATARGPQPAARSPP